MRIAHVRRLAPPLLVVALLALPASLPAAGSGPVPADRTADGTWAFTNVTVIPMDGERVLPDQTVIVVDGVITEVGPSGAIEVPAEATRIDGAGRYLMPGLAEMHAHVPPQQNRPPQEALDELMFLYVANGITSSDPRTRSSWRRRSGTTSTSRRCSTSPHPPSTTTPPRPRRRRNVACATPRPRATTS